MRNMMGSGDRKSLALHIGNGFQYELALHVIRKA